jgi:anion-transporting  ArsA/GET3 family ATPase
MKDLISKRIVMVTGKGGVGRTTVTAALAKAAARAGKRVLVAEIGEPGEDYSPLARHFGSERLPNEARPLAPGISGTYMLAERGQELFLTSVLGSRMLVRAALSSEAVQRILRAAPSFREMGIFYHMLTHVRRKLPDGGSEFELVLIDMPATGHALALTTLPEVLLSVVSSGPIADALREGQAYCNDPALGAAYIVTLPETLPVTEALELAEGLRKARVHLGGVLLNRMPTDVFSAEERAAVSEHIGSRNLFGKAAFRSFALCRQEAARLERELGVPLHVIAEAPRGEPAVVDFIAKGLVL